MKPKDIVKVFSRFCPDGALKEIASGQIPLCAQNIFNRFSKIRNGRTVPYFEDPSCVREFFEIDYKNGDRIFATKQRRINTDNLQESTTLIDIDNKNDYLGYGRLSFNMANEEGFIPNIPYVGYIETEREHERKGFGTRRLLAMNGLARAFYGIPLHSSNVFVDERGENLWFKMVEAGKAKQIEFGDIRSYAFK